MNLFPGPRQPGTGDKLSSWKSIHVEILLTKQKHCIIEIQSGPLFFSVRSFSAQLRHCFLSINERKPHATSEKHTLCSFFGISAGSGQALSAVINSVVLRKIN